jgi:hypothetical protein
MGRLGMLRKRKPADYGEPGWEYLLYADELVAGISRYSTQWRDYEMQASSPTGQEIALREVFADIAAREHAAAKIFAPFAGLFDAKTLTRAFGKPDEPGDVRRIRRLAAGLVDLYASLLTWATNTRGARVPSEAEPVYALAAAMADEPLHQIRGYVTELDTTARAGIVSARSGEPPETPVRMKFTLELSISPERAEKATAALEALRIRVTSRLIHDRS